MLGNKTISLKQLNYLHLFVTIFSYISLMTIVILCIYNCYQLFLIDYNSLQEIKKTNHGNVRLDIFLEALIFKVLFLVAKASFLSFLVISIKFLIFQIQLTSNYLISLDKQRDISPILGRLIARHFRYNSGISVSAIVYLNRIAKRESRIINGHSERNEFEYFLKKYDVNYHEDLKVRSNSIGK